MKPGALHLAALLVIAAAPLAAQNYREVTDTRGRSRSQFGINLQAAFPQGEFKQFVGNGYGLGGNFTFFVDRANRAGIRIFFSWIEYGRTTERLPLSPTLPGLLVDLTTANDIYSFGIGPEFQLGTGDFRPYVTGAIGASNFATTTSAEGTNNSSPFASSTNFNDWTLAWYGGGGVQYGISHGRRPVALDLGLRYQSHGETSYLREGSITPQPGGGVSFTPIQSKTDLLIAHLGVQIGI
jgi:opacity protein-like surface antigen